MTDQRNSEFPDIRLRNHAGQHYRFANTFYETRTEPPVSVGTPVPDGRGRAGYDLIRPHIDLALAGDRVEFVETLSLADGRSREMKTTYVPHFDENGGVRGVICLAQDVAEQARAEQDLIDSNKQIERQSRELEEMAASLANAHDRIEFANRTKSDFLATMSHELRTPLNAVIGLSDLIKDETFGPVGSPKYSEYAVDINEAGLHLLALVNDILALSKVESGVEEIHEESIVVADTIQAVLRQVRKHAERGGLRLDLDLPDAPPLLRADRRKLTQILTNLLSNAVKFTDPGGKVVLKVWCRSGSGYVIQVIDTGIGIASEDIPKALSQFGQVDSNLNRRYEGTGLGLPLTKALIEMHGGYLDLQSELGSGTTVTVRFPADRIVWPRDTRLAADQDKRAAS